MRLQVSPSRADCAMPINQWLGRNTGGSKLRRASASNACSNGTALFLFFGFPAELDELAHAFGKADAGGRGGAVDILEGLAVKTDWHPQHGIAAGGVPAGAAATRLRRRRH